MFIRRDRYVRGDHNAISDDSGQKYKRSDMKFTWDNKLVGIDEWEEKQPQLTIRGRKEKISVPDARTESRDQQLADPPITPAQMI
jgi:hypothetical protein